MHVTIVGAGIVGCAIGYELASRGAAVSIVDVRGPGRGATQASAGILAPRIEGHSKALLDLCLASLRMYDSFVTRLRADAAQPFEYARTGTLQVAMSSEEATELARCAQALDAAGVEHALMGGADAVREVPGLSDRAIAALLVPEHGYTAVGELIGALAEAATRRDVAFLAAHVHAVQSDDSGARVVTSARTFDTDAVVVTAGSWSDDVAGAPVRPSPVRPIRGQLLHLYAPARLGTRAIWGARCYLVPWRDGSVLVGATTEDVGFDERATVAGVRGLLEAAIELVPSLGAAVLHEVRVGLRPMTMDGLPAIGASSTMRRVSYAIGHYRNGVLLAPLTAALIADLVLEGREGAELALTRPERFGL